MASALLGTVLLQAAIGEFLYPQYLRVAKPVLTTLAAGSRSAAEIFDLRVSVNGDTRDFDELNRNLVST